MKDSRTKDSYCYKIHTLSKESSLPPFYKKLPTPMWLKFLTKKDEILFNHERNEVYF